MSRSLTTTGSSATDPRFTTVVSSSGFSAGDYVYQRPDGTYGTVSGTAAGSATFNVNDTVPSLSTDVTTIAAPNATLDGAALQNMAAKLSNGNVVVVYKTRASVRGAFAILDSTGAIVVGPTEISTTIIPSNALISVVALTGGGFVVYFLDTTNSKPTWGIYTNTGTVTTALAVDTAATASVTTGQLLYGCALPNGGFALSYATSGNIVAVRGFNSIGTAAYAWTSAGNIPAGTPVPTPISAKSNNDTCVLFRSSTANTLTYTVLSSAGASVTTGSISVTSSAISYCPADVCTLSNDSFVLAYQADSTTTPKFRLLTGTTLGSENSVPVGGVNTGTIGYPAVYVTAISTGGFIYFYQDRNQTTYYVPYNNAGTALNVGTNVYTFNEFCSYNSVAKPGFVERSGYLDIYFTTNVAGSVGIVVRPYILSKSTMELTNYRLYSSSTTPVSVTTIVSSTTLTVNGYAKSTSTPVNAAFLAAASSTLTSNLSASAVMFSPVIIDAANTCNSTPAVATSPNGDIIVAYKTSTGSLLRVVKYDKNLTFVKAISANTAVVNTSPCTVDVAILADGKIVIANGGQTSSNYTDLTFYDSNLNVLTASTNTVYTQGGVVAIAALTGNRVVVVYKDTSNYFSYTVVSNTGTTLGTGTFLGGSAIASSNNVSVCALPNGGFAARAYYSGATQEYMFIRVETSTNTWSSLMAYNFGSNQNFGGKNQVAANSAGLAFALGSSATASSYVSLVTGIASDMGAGTAVSSVASLQVDTVSANNRVSIGVTGAGTPVIAACNGSNNGIFLLLPGWAFANTSNQNTNITNYTSNAYPTLAPMPGNSVALAYIDTNAKVNLGIYNVTPYSLNNTYTAGVSASRASFNLNPTASSGYTMVGVAATDCAAGGAGQVQTNGIATLNSQYSSTTAFQGFDFQVPGNRGVRGTIAGNVVTLIGDA